MNATAITMAVPHMKVHGFVGDHRLERCEDAGCSVDEDGNARCGRLACPSCGFSGSNLSVQETDRSDSLAHCSCGHAWILEHDPVTAAA